MAGIGFSINKIVQEKKMTSKIKAFTYASIVTTLPLLMGELVLMALYLLVGLTSIHITDRNLLVSIITYDMLSSLLLNSLFAVVISRYLSDKIYNRDVEGVLSTYWGSQLFLLLLGGFGWGLFMLFAGLGPVYSILTWLLFCELLLSWNAMNFLTLIKDYAGLVKAFLATAVTTIVMGAIFIGIGLPTVFALLLGLIFGYASFFIMTLSLIYDQFPRKVYYNQLFSFLSYMDQYFDLSVMGFAIQLGLLAHIMMTWFSPIGIQVKGLFYVAPYYDLSVFIASLTMLATTVYFTIAMEVEFFKVYRQYYLSFSHAVSLEQLEENEQKLVATLKDGLKKTAQTQLVVTLLSISAGTVVLDYLPLGFNSTMNGYFRVLCVAYAIFGLANVMSLSSLYFGNVRQNRIAGLVFASAVIILTGFTIVTDQFLFGFGFLGATIIYFIMVWQILEKSMDRITYQVLGSQPLLAQDRRGVFDRLARWLNGKVVKILKRERSLEH